MLAIVPHDHCHLFKLTLQEPEQFANSWNGDGELITLQNVVNQYVDHRSIALQRAEHDVINAHRVGGDFRRAEPRPDVLDLVRKLGHEPLLGALLARLLGAARVGIVAMRHVKIKAAELIGTPLPSGLG